MNKAVLSLIALISLILAGCVQNRVVRDNTFYSNLPKLKVSVTDNFAYVGENKTWRAVRPTNVNGLIGNDISRYLFIETNDAAQVIRQADVYSYRIDDGYLTFHIFDNIRYKISTGQIEIDGMLFEECVYFSSPDEGDLKYLAEKGYDAESVYLVRTLARFEIPETWGFQELFLINYSEEINSLSPIVPFTLSAWLEIDGHSSLQKQLIDEFLRRSEEYVKISALTKDDRNRMKQ